MSAKIGCVIGKWDRGVQGARVGSHIWGNWRRALVLRGFFYHDSLVQVRDLRPLHGSCLWICDNSLVNVYGSATTPSLMSVYLQQLPRLCLWICDRSLVHERGSATTPSFMSVDLRPLPRSWAWIFDHSLVHERGSATAPSFMSVDLRPLPRSCSRHKGFFITKQIVLKSFQAWDILSQKGLSNLFDKGCLKKHVFTYTG